MTNRRRTGLFVGAVFALIAFLRLVLAMHPDLGAVASEASWAPAGLAGLLTWRGALALALFALAATLLFISLRPRRGESAAGFFTPEDRAAISRAIRDAESRTSGEVRVHVAADSRGRPRDAAEASFTTLGMQDTAARNGVLIYISVADHRFAIIGDEGIDRAVPAGFWEDVTAEMAAHFARREFAAGTIAAVHRVGEKLNAYFPRERGDVNELPNEISTE